MGVSVAACVLVIPTYFGTIDNASACPECGPSCLHTACVIEGCGDAGAYSTNACTYANFAGPHLVECSFGCRTKVCGTVDC